MGINCNSIGDGIWVDLHAEMAAFDSLPPSVRKAVRESNEKLACEKAAEALRQGVPVAVLLQELEEANVPVDELIRQLEADDGDGP